MASSRRINTAFALLSLVVPLVTFGSHRPLLPSKPQFTVPPRIQTEVSASVPLAATLTFAADRPVRTQLLVSDGRLTEHLHETDAFAEDVSLPLLGLKAASRYMLTIVITDEFRNQYVWPLPIEIVTAGLPSPFPSIVATVSDKERMEQGVTLFSVNQPDAGYIVAVDEAGDVVWYYRQSVSGIADVRRSSNGHILFTDAEGAAEIDVLGNVITRWHPGRFSQSAADVIQVAADTIHHEIYETQSGNLLTLSTEARFFPDYPASETDATAALAPSIVVGDVVFEFDRDGRNLHYWSLLNILDPYRIGFGSLSRVGYYPEFRASSRDWSHANAVIEDPADDSLIISVRHQDAVVKIDRTTGRLIWILGTPDGWRLPWSRYLLAPTDDLEWQYHQHAPMLTPNHTLLLFDNGNFRHRPFDDLPADNYSRVVEYSIDQTVMTVQQVWSYGPPQDDFYSAALGAADWLPITNNILVTDGFRTSATNPNMMFGRIFEVTHTTPADKVFELIIEDDSESENGLDWTVYRAERLPTLYPPEP